MREDALAAARTLLLAHGPSAITLTAVANALGMAHGNVAHHFGSAAGLQSALAERMIRELVEAVEGAITHLRERDGDRAAVVDLVFTYIPQVACRLT